MQRLKVYVIRGLIGFGALVLSQVAMMGVAQAATRTWTGGGVDTNFSTAANWGGTAPIAGDDLVFTPTTADIAATNDLIAGTSFNSLTVNGSPAAYQYVDITGNAFSVVAGISATSTVGGARLGIANDVTFSASQNVTVSGASAMSFDGIMALGTSNLTISVGSNLTIFTGIITGSGTITKSGIGMISLLTASPAYDGAIIVNAGKVIATDAASFGTNVGDTTINAGADILLSSCGTSSFTMPENLVLSGASSLTSGDNPFPKLSTYNKVDCSGYGASADETFGNTMGNGNVTLSGAISLGSNVTFGGLATNTILTGALSGSFSISQISGWGGTLTLSGSSNTTTTVNGSLAPTVFNKTIADVVPANSLNILENAIIVLNGTRGSVNISGGTLKGTGTVGSLNLVSGKIAPGLSPGCINSGNLTFSGGSLDEEIGGTTACTGYDQLKVTGTVALGATTTLNLIHYGGFTPASGNAFTIIDNDGADAVTGTFAGIAEGGTVTIAGYVYKVSYAGGTGNDVIATVMTVPAAPSTGLGLRLHDPVAMLVATLLIAGCLLVFAYRQLKSR